MLGNYLFSSGNNLLLPALKMQWTVSDKPVSAFTASTPPRASADPSGHIQGSSGKGALPCSPGLPARPPSTGASDANLQELSQQHCPAPALGKEVPFPERAWTPAELLLQECDGAGDMGLHTAPRAIHAAGIQVQLQPAVTEQCPCQKAGWKLTVGMGIRAGENKLSFRVHYGNVHFHGQFPPCLGTSPVEPANTTEGFPPSFPVSPPPPHCTLHPSHPLCVQMYKESCCFSGSLLFSAV